MITNELEYRVTRRELKKFRAAIEAFDVDEAGRRTGSPVLAKAEYDAMESQAQGLAEQVAEYEALKSGKVGVLKAESLADLPVLLIKARIARGLTQAALAEKLGVKEQQVQRYEAETYASASLRRLVEVADALDLEISEVAELRESAAKV